MLNLHALNTVHAFVHGRCSGDMPHSSASGDSALGPGASPVDVLSQQVCGASHHRMEVAAARRVGWGWGAW